MTDADETPRPFPETDAIDRRTLLVRTGAALVAPVLPVIAAAGLRRNGWVLAPGDV